MEVRPIRKFELELRLLEAVEHLMATQKVKFIMKDTDFDGQAGTNHLSHRLDGLIAHFKKLKLKIFL